MNGHGVWPGTTPQAFYGHRARTCCVPDMQLNGTRARAGGVHNLGREGSADSHRMGVREPILGDAKNQAARTTARRRQYIASAACECQLHCTHSRKWDGVPGLADCFGADDDDLARSRAPSQR